MSHLRKTILIFPGTILLVLLAGFYIRDLFTDERPVIEQDIIYPWSGQGLQDSSPSAPKASMPVNSDSQDKMQEYATRFETALEYHEARRQASRQWRESRGYHLAEDFEGYDGPDSYIGPHSYGYLSEEDLKVLADNGDIDAQILYASFYLQDNPDAARMMFEDVVSRTEQTAPLANLAGLILRNIAGNGTQIAEYELLSAEHYNGALAYFVYMQDRQDAMADMYLQVSGFSSLPSSQKDDIVNKASRLKEQFDSLRTARGLPPYVNASLDLPGAMGISYDQFMAFEEKFDYANLDAETLEALTINTSMTLRVRSPD